MSKVKKQSNKDQTEAQVFPSKLSPSEKKKAESEFAQFRLSRLNQMTEEERHYSRVLQLKYRMEEYINSKSYSSTYTFSYFLKEYIFSLNKKKMDFSREISLHFAQLSRLLNDKDEPNNKILVRLEIHSNNSIPALLWYRVVEKRKELELMSDVNLRKTESKRVRKNMA